MRLNSKLLFLIRALLLIYAVLGAVHPQRSASYYIDFDQLYLGGSIARAGRWDLLYPVPHPDASRNAGLASDLKPGAERIWQRVTGGRPRPIFKYIYPPPAALVLMPLACFDYAKARLVWQVLGGISVWAIALIAGRIYRALRARTAASWPELAIVSTLVLSHRSLAELNQGNISHIVGLLIAASILALLHSRPGIALPLILLAAGLKVIPGCLLVVLAVAFPRACIRPLVSCFLALGASFLLTGVRVWEEYVRVIMPTLSRPWLPDQPTDVSTSSIYGVIGLLMPEYRIPAAWSLAIRSSSVLTLALILAGYLWDFRRLRREPPRVVGFAAGLVAWSLFFSPILWPHYRYYYYFCIPWIIIWAARCDGRSIVALGTLFLLFGPGGRLPPLSLSFYAARLVGGWACIGLMMLSALEAVRPAGPGDVDRDGPRDVIDGPVATPGVGTASSREA